VFFGKGPCSTCHAGLDLSNHKVATNQVHLTFSAKIDAGPGIRGHRSGADVQGPIALLPVQRPVGFPRTRFMLAPF